MHSGKQKDFQIFWWGQTVTGSSQVLFIKSTIIIFLVSLFLFWGQVLGISVHLFQITTWETIPLEHDKVWLLVSLTAVFLAGVPARCLPSANRG